MSTAIAIFGASGRMGQAAIREILERRDCVLAAALVRSGSDQEGGALSPVFGPAAGAVRFNATLDAGSKAAVLIDFTNCSAFDLALKLCLRHNLALVSGSTGLSAVQLVAARSAASHIPVLWASNFSLGVALLRRLTAIAAATLDFEFDVEIHETHHRLKRDAPSGTALTLGQSVAAARGQSFDQVARYARHGEGAPREPGEIGFAVSRAADVIGDHSVLFAGPGECIELSHRAGNRDVFARGAVRAARWLAGREPGWYEIDDVVAASSTIDGH